MSTQVVSFLYRFGTGTNRDLLTLEVASFRAGTGVGKLSPASPESRGFVRRRGGANGYVFSDADPWSHFVPRRGRPQVALIRAGSHPVLVDNLSHFPQSPVGSFGAGASAPSSAGAGRSGFVSSLRAWARWVRSARGEWSSSRFSSSLGASSWLGDSRTPTVGARTRPPASGLYPLSWNPRRKPARKTSRIRDYPEGLSFVVARRPEIGPRSGHDGARSIPAIPEEPGIPPPVGRPDFSDRGWPSRRARPESDPGGARCGTASWRGSGRGIRGGGPAASGRRPVPGRARGPW